MKQATTKKPEIIKVAIDLFNKNGYENASVESIIKEVGIAKGTFYYFFESKEALLKEVVNQILDLLIENASLVASKNSLSPIQKMSVIFSNSTNNQQAEKMSKSLHYQENRALHEEINIQLVLKLSPIVAQIVNEGVEKGVFQVEKPLEVTQFLLVGSQFLFDEGFFKWNQEEYDSRRIVMQEIIEKSLGAKKGSFTFISERKKAHETKQ
jgi:AcrR family transcriptional regulator